MEKNNKMTVLFICFIYSLLRCKLLNGNAAVNPEKLKIVERKLHVPPLSELQTVFRTELLKNYAEVKVEIVDSPDFTKQPFNLAAPGLGGRPTLLDVGGVSLYDPQIEKQKLFDIKTIVENLNYTTAAFVTGPAGGPWPFVQKDCDVAVNLVLNKQKSTTSSYVITLDKTRGKIVCQALPLNETRIAVQGNLFLSEGKSGKVLKVYAKKRIGEYSFIASMRKSITDHFGEKKLVGIGGVFVLQTGKTDELFPNLLQEPIPKGSKLRKAKNYYIDEGSAQETGIGTFVSAKTELQLFTNHFHLFSTHGDCGHYLRDTTPAITEYEGYFTPGEVLYRVNQAPPSKLIVAVNVVLNKQKSTTSSYVITLDKTCGKIVCQALPLNETRIAVQGNLFLSEGKSGKVLKVYVKKRIGEYSFIASMRKSITDHFGEKNLLNAQTTVNIANVKVVRRTLYQPSLAEIQTVFHEALLKNFDEAKVEIVDSPDLTRQPFNLAAPGLGGSTTLLDVGGLTRYSPQIDKQPLYDIETIVGYLNYTKEACLLGAGNGPWIYLRKECDLVVNVILKKPTLAARSYIITLDKTQGKIVCQALPLNETRFAVQGNLFLSEGKPGKVIKVFAKKRIGKFSFTATMRKSIENRYGDTKLVGMGGVVVLQKGKANSLFANVASDPVPPGSKLTIMKKYSYLAEGCAPEIGVGTLVSAKTELDLIGSHFHFFSLHGDSGHYVQDTTPAFVEYEGYFTTGAVLYKIDQAPPSQLDLISDDY